MMIIKRASVFALIVLFLFFAYLMISYSPTYIYRYAFWTPPGNEDLQKFPSREIKNPDIVFHFKEKLNEDYVESLFEDKFRFIGVNTFEEYIKETSTTALIIVKNDTIIYEKYFDGFQREDLFMAMSMTKSFVYSLIGIAIEEGYIKGVEEPITNYLPELKERDARFEKITLKHLLMMCSGIDQHRATLFNIPLPWDGDPISYYHPKLRQHILENLDIIDNPGKQFYYNDFNAELLGLILERAIKKSVSEYLEEKIWKPCGMKYPALWALDSKDSGFEKMSSGLFARPIDYARYARLYLELGNWEEKQIIPEVWIIESTHEDVTVNDKDYYPPAPAAWLNNTYYKYHWKGHINPDSTTNFSIGGVMGQNIFIAPHKQLIIVHCGESHSYYGVGDLWNIERLIDNPFYNILQSKGLSQAIAFADSLIQNDQDIIISERHLNTMGYGFLYQGKLDDAIAVFKLNVRVYPSSSNVYDSLGEVYMKNGQKELAIKNYKKSLELNPNNTNAMNMLTQLENEN